jgi:hypothetical protein
MMISVVVEDRRRKLQDTPKTFKELLAHTTQAFQPCLDSFVDKTVNFQVHWIWALLGLICVRVLI